MVQCGVVEVGVGDEGREGQVVGSICSGVEGGKGGRGEKGGKGRGGEKGGEGRGGEAGE